MRPSKKSVMLAAANTSAAPMRQPALPVSSARYSGIIAMRSSVSRLGRFIGNLVFF